MIEDQYLSFFITEQLYLLKELAPVQVLAASSKVTADLSEVKEPEPEKITPEVAELAVWTSQLTSSDKGLLANILKAMDRDPGSINIMEGINAYTPHYKSLLCFGYQKELELKTGQPGLLYEPYLASGKTHLISATLAELESDKAQKMLLWNALKKMLRA